VQGDKGLAAEKTRAPDAAAEKAEWAARLPQVRAVTVYVRSAATQRRICRDSPVIKICAPNAAYR